MKLLTLPLLALLSLGATADVPATAHAAPTMTAWFAAPDPRSVPAPSYAPEDAADSLWRAGRVAIADENWREAARLFERLVTDHPRSAYAGDALYWQAFALQRLGNSGDLRRAARALEMQREQYASSATWTSGEGPALLARVNGRLARTAGDADAAEAIAEVAAGAAAMAADIAAAVAGEVEGADPVERERMRAEMRAEIAQSIAAAQREVASLDRERMAMEREAARMGRESSRMGGGRGRFNDDVPAECEDVVTDERVEALNALMQMNSEQALPVLRRVLARRDRCSEYLRRKAAFIVSQRRTDEAAQLLVDVARTDPDRGTRGEAIFWLSQSDSERAIEVLEQVLLKDEPDEELQKRAIYALSQTRSERAGRILRDYVRRADAPEELRGDAIFWLGQTNRRDTDNTAFLRELFPTLESDELREKVIFSVSQRRTPENAQWLLGRARDRQLTTELRKTALFWASQGGAVTAAQLGEIYRTSGEEEELRSQVIFALSQRRNDTGAVDLLLEIARTETDRELRRTALFWLGQSRDPRAAAALEEIINKP